MSAWQRPWHDHIDGAKSVDEAERVSTLRARAMLGPDARAAIGYRAVHWVEQIRARQDAGLMEVFLAEYGLSTEEGIELMSLAEALLRVPDAATIDALIEDKIAHGDWQRHLGQSPSTLVNTASIGLLITGRLLDDGAPARSAAGLRKLVKRLGQPAIRTAVAAAMAQMGRQFVLGETITAAMTRAKNYEQCGYTFSYDMLGEAALTARIACTNVIGHKNAARLGVDLGKVTIDADCKFDRRDVLMEAEIDVPFPEITLTVNCDTRASRDELARVGTETAKNCAIAKLFEAAGTILTVNWVKVG